MGTTSLAKKAFHTIREDGIGGCVKKTNGYIKKQIKKRRRVEKIYKDVLFISGCNENLPHPWRYRVKHQREQLEAMNYTTDEVYFPELELDAIRYYRSFVFFRCPETEAIKEFVALAKCLNKTVVYDIDDLVVDTKYTDQIKYVASLPVEEKQAYDANVMSMQSMLKSCNYATTTTNCLKKELANYCPKVYINRNVASEEMILLSEQALKNKPDNKNVVKMGYFSGSITHNADVELILPVIITIMNDYENVELYLMGEVDLPDELKTFEARVKKLPFSDWRKLPEIIAEMDINLAPLENTIFNEAKSENKWMEAALVKTVTVASDVGAFHDCVEHKVTGILCKDAGEWEAELRKVVEDPEYRKKISENAYLKCKENYATFRTGLRLAKLYEEEKSTNYVFVLPGLEISGGIKVALRHAAMLQKKGNEVSIFTLDCNEKWCEFEDCRFPVINLEDTTISGKIDYMIATMWTTVKVVEEYPYAVNKYYLVQNYEAGFYEETDPLRIRANQSYRPSTDVKFIPISKWCQKWLEEEFGQTSVYGPNGLEIERFPEHKRSLDGKIRILVEGDCAVDYKNVDESFEIIDALDPEKYEVWYMSYNAEPKETYRVDKFFNRVPYEKVPEIYAQCDILIKTSLLESFSYPPLEMMATGGYVLAVPNGGNVEYLKDNENCLLYKAGNISQACEKIENLIASEELQQKLYLNGLKTAKERAWENVTDEILEMYGAN